MVGSSNQVFKGEVGVRDIEWDSLVRAPWNWMFSSRETTQMEVKRRIKTKPRETPAFKGRSCPGVWQLCAF